MKDLQLDRQQFTRRRDGCDGSGGGRFGVGSGGSLAGGMLMSVGVVVAT